MAQVLASLPTEDWILDLQLSCKQTLRGKGKIVHHLAVIIHFNGLHFVAPCASITTKLKTQKV